MPKTLGRILCLGLLLGAGPLPNARPTESSPPTSDGPALGDLGKVGTVEFPTSCDPSVQKEFERGVALLHSFFYSEARRVFTLVAEKDPDCAMAYWGIAMTYDHPIWTAPDSSELAAGAAAVDRALAASEKDGRESEYIRAMEAFYAGLECRSRMPRPARVVPRPSSTDSKGGRCVSVGRWSGWPRITRRTAMRALRAPSWHRTSGRSDSGTEASAEILETWYAKEPNHPGWPTSHPQLRLSRAGGQGLARRNAYAAMQPWVPHALHMPHIYTRSACGRRPSRPTWLADAARKDAAFAIPTPHPSKSHALDYLIYAYLQSGQTEG
jgi:hypothetical protein